MSQPVKNVHVEPGVTSALFTWEEPYSSGEYRVNRYRVIVYPLVKLAEIPDTATAPPPKVKVVREDIVLPSPIPIYGEQRCRSRQTRCEFFDLEPNTDYHYEISARNEYGWSDPVDGYFTTMKRARKIVVRAHGEEGDETFEVRIGDVVVGEATVGSTEEYQDFMFRADRDLRGPLTVAFTNDHYNGGDFDRNLWIDYVSSNGHVFESEAPTTYSEGAWTNGEACSPGFKKSERITCGGIFTYKVIVGKQKYEDIPIPVKLGTNGGGDHLYGPYGDTVYEDPTDPYDDDTTPDPVAATIIKVRARGTAGGERFAVRSGPEIIGHVVVGKGWRTYRFVLDHTLSGGDFVVALMNDNDDGHTDFNLQIDYVKINGLMFESEDPSTWSNGTWDAATGCAPGNKQSEFLHCNGGFFYQLP